MFESRLRTTANKVVSVSSPQMEADFLAAQQEIKSTLGLNIVITDAYRTEAEQKATEAKYGYTGGTSHTLGKALDVKVAGTTAFKVIDGKQTHIPTEEALRNAKAIQGIMAKHGFGLTYGEKDIVHYDYNRLGGRVISTDKLPGKNKEVRLVDSFFSQFGVLGSNLSNINSLPEKKMKEMANFLIKAGKQKVG